MAMATHDPAIDPVLCSPFDAPTQHWQLDNAGRARSGMAPLLGRRDSMLLSPVPDDAKDAQMVLSLANVTRNALINAIRDKVTQWRQAGYPGATSVSVRLMEHWAAPHACFLRPFFAQREAIETLIWLREVATRQTPERRFLEKAASIHNDDLERHAVKMATGTGKTAVMAMLIAWQTLNAARTTRRRNLRHGERFLVITPGITIKDRLQELKPSDPHNVYDEMGLVPRDLRATLNRAHVEIVNFQSFTRQDINTLGFPRSGSKGKRAHRELIADLSDEDRKETNEQAARRVLKHLLESRAYGDVVVLNDEAHHCYLPRGTDKQKGAAAKEADRAAVWFNVLRSLRSLGALGEITEAGQASIVYDFSATPMWIDTSAKDKPDPFQWVVSDFGLMDAIESGLTKVPRVPVDDDAEQHRTRWRNLYDNTPQKRLPTPSKDGATKQLPAPFRNALDAQYKDYATLLEAWTKVRPETAPTIIIVANTIANANAIYEHVAGWTEEGDDGEQTLHAGTYHELSNVVDGQWASPLRTLIVHSELDDASAIKGTTRTLLAQQAARLPNRDLLPADDIEAVREVLNTVGKEGKPGAQIRCVISVGMLTEGWDARTVTHIVGYRAFSTQLLCEQVTGRALRRTSYEDFREDGSGRLTPEYAEVVGIPFEFMPSKGRPEDIPQPVILPRTHVHTVQGRSRHRMVWPRVTEYRRIPLGRTLQLDGSRVLPWQMQPLSEASMALLSPHIGETKIIAVRHRDAQAVFKMAAEMVSEFSTAENVVDSRATLFKSAVRIVKRWLEHPDVACPKPHELLVDDDQRRSAVLNVLEACSGSAGAGDRRIAVLDAPPLFDTSDVDFYTTLKHIHKAKHSELSHAACHSHMEKQLAQILDRHPLVVSWARNFQTGWEAPYYFKGVWHRYTPDFIVRLQGELNLIIECKGVPDDKSAAAEAYMQDHWIPCVAGTADLPDSLRHWDYLIVTDIRDARNQISAAANQATQPADLALAAS